MRPWASWLISIAGTAAVILAFFALLPASDRIPIGGLLSGNDSGSPNANPASVGQAAKARQHTAKRNPRADRGCWSAKCVGCARRAWGHGPAWLEGRTRLAGAQGRGRTARPEGRSRATWTKGRARPPRTEGRGRSCRSQGRSGQAWAQGRWRKGAECVGWRARSERATRGLPAHRDREASRGRQDPRRTKRLRRLKRFELGAARAAWQSIRDLPTR